MTPVLELLALLLAAAVLVGAGAAIGMLVIAPRLTRWEDRDEEAGDADR